MIGKKIKATGVIGFGGGSSMDVAKLSALILGSNEDLEQAWGVSNAKGPRLTFSFGSNHSWYWF